MAMRTMPCSPQGSEEKCCSKFEDGKLECDCDDDIRTVEWFWEEYEEEESNYKLDPKNFIVTFHPVYSSGTSFVRTNEPFKPNMHYYWELKMTSKLYGTDVMIGIGTDEGKPNLTHFKYKFCSMLGSDGKTWGYSYHGNIQHNNLTRKYGESFGLSSTVGVHLDMCSGKLEYYLNKKPLGIAFRGLKKKELYPMACATAAQTSMKLNCAVSQEETLQMLCLKQVHQNPYLYDKYCSIPGLYNNYSEKYFWMVPRAPIPKPSKEQEEEELFMLAMNNNSSKKNPFKSCQSHRNCLLHKNCQPNKKCLNKNCQSNKKCPNKNCKSNKKTSKNRGRSSREPPIPRLYGIRTPLRLDLNDIDDYAVVRLICDGFANNSRR